MKVGLEYGLGCGGFDGYRTVTLPKYMEKEINNPDKMREWLEKWLLSHVKGFKFDVGAWYIFEAKNEI